MPDFKSVYWLQELSKDNSVIAGSKAANLGELLNAGFPVPPGFALSVTAYFSFIKSNGLDKLVEEKLANLDDGDEVALRRASDEIRQAFANAPTTPEVRADVVRAYNKLCGASLIPSLEQEVRVAVRGSQLPQVSGGSGQGVQTNRGVGIEGDAEPASFLNVKGSEELIHSLKKCWSSLFSAAAIRMRARGGESHFAKGIGIVVQKMVESQVAGIVFTTDPAERDPDILSIEAGFGLGEALAAGIVQPDKYVVNKQAKQVVKREVRKQETMLAFVAGENRQLAVPEELQEARKLTDTQVLELAEVGKKIEGHFSKAVKLEWAMENDEVNLLQATPLEGTTAYAEEVPQIPEELRIQKKGFGGESVGGGRAASRDDFWRKSLVAGNAQ